MFSDSINTDELGALRLAEPIDTAEDPFDRPNTPDDVIVNADVNDAVGAVGTDKFRSSESTMAISELYSIKFFGTDNPSEVKNRRNQHISPESHSWQSEKPKSSGK